MAQVRYCGSDDLDIGNYCCHSANRASTERRRQGLLPPEYDLEHNVKQIHPPHGFYAQLCKYISMNPRSESTHPRQE